MNKGYPHLPIVVKLVAFVIDRPLLAYHSALVEQLPQNCDSVLRHLPSLADDLLTALALDSSKTLMSDQRAVPAFIQCDCHCRWQ